MSTVIYLPVNNQQLPLNDSLEKQIVTGVLAEVHKYHGKDKTFSAEVLLYLSAPSLTMMAALMSAEFKWIKQVHISVDPTFDQKSLDDIAKRMTGREDLKDVFCFRVIPRGILDKKQLKDLQEGLMKRFGEVYLMEIPEVILSEAEIDA